MNWSCSHCTFSNHPDLLCCEMCGLSAVPDAENALKPQTLLSPQFPTKAISSQIKALAAATAPIHHLHQEITTGINGKSDATLLNLSLYTNGILQLIEQTQQDWINGTVNTNSSSNNSTSTSISKIKRKIKSPPHIYRLCFPYCVHVSQKNSFGSGWSCGYRNIQMLCSSLIQLPAYRAVMFDGSGRVPDIKGLQHWIEVAWKDGFDTEVRCTATKKHKCNKQSSSFQNEYFKTNISKHECHTFTLLF